jgi:hypothetical protein
VSRKPRDLVWLRNVLIFIGLLVLVGLACVVTPFLIWPPGQVLGMYKIEDRIEAASPDGKYVASGYHVWGGATVQNSTIIEIRPKAGWFNQKSEAQLIVDMTQPGDNPFGISWADNNDLVVTYTAGSTYIQKPKWKDVNIKYIPK